MKKFILSSLYMALFFISHIYASEEFFRELNVKYSNSLILDRDLKEFAPFVCKKGFGFYHNIIEDKLIPKILSMQKDYVAPKLSINFVDVKICYSVFADETIKKGTLIRPYIGCVKTINAAEHFLQKEYGFSVCKDQCELIIDSREIGNESRFFKRSGNFNSYVDFVYNDEKKDLFQCWVIATKDILPGHEIVCDFGYKDLGNSNVDNEVRSLYTDKDVHIYACQEKGKFKIFINNDSLQFENQGVLKERLFDEILETKFITENNNVFILVAYKQDNGVGVFVLLKDFFDQSVYPMKRSSFSERLGQEAKYFENLNVQKLLFKKADITYTNDLVIDDDLKSFKSRVFTQGFHQSLIDSEELKSAMISIPASYIPPILTIREIDDTIGCGVFAGEKIEAGALIRPYTGRVFSLSDAERKAGRDSRYGFSFYSSNGNMLVIDSKDVGNESRFFNHSYDPNCEMIFVYNDEKKELFNCWIFAKKNIEVGQEICWDYGSSYWRALDIVPEDKNVIHIYQDKDSTVYVCPEEKLFKICSNDDILLLNDSDNSEDYLFETFLDSKVIVREKEVCVVMAIKKNHIIIPVVLYKNSVEDFTLLSNSLPWPKSVRAQIQECFSNIVKK